MKAVKTLLSAAAILLGLTCAAQNCDIDISVVGITKGEVVPEAVESRLEAKLANAMAKAGILSAPYEAQFFLAARFDDAFNDIIAGPSPKVVVKTSLTLYIGDAVNQKIFASQSFDLKGVGASDEQAYTRALNSVSPANKQIQEFLIKGRDRIVEYYDNNYPSLIADARRAMTTRNYDEALFYISTIPPCCKGYAEARALAMQITTDQLDYVGSRLLAQARGAWAASPDETGAAEAYRYLSQIDPACASAADAEAFGKKIAQTTQKQWEFENVTKYQNALELENKRIAAAKEVAVAWAKNRPQTVNRYVFIR